MLGPSRNQAVPQVDDMSGPVLAMRAGSIELMMKEQDAMVIVGEHVEDMLLESAAGLAKDTHYPIGELVPRKRAAHRGVPRHGEGHIVGTTGQPPWEIALGERGVQLPEAVLAWMTHCVPLDSPNRGPSIAQYCSVSS